MSVRSSLRDPVLWVLVTLAVGLRLALFVSGRSPLDGDEAIMGLMANAILEGREYPLYWWGQDYMGTPDLPLLACLQALGNADWAHGVWPIRLTGLIYLVALLVANHLLVWRLAGREAARCATFFLAVAPYFWMDYSMRMRCAQAMMALGSVIVLMSVELAERLASGKRVLPLAAMLGVATGIAWWYYPLVSIYLVMAFLLTIHVLATAPMEMGRAPWWRMMLGIFVVMAGAWIALTTVGVVGQNSMAMVAEKERLVRIPVIWPAVWPLVAASAALTVPGGRALRGWLGSMLAALGAAALGFVVGVAPALYALLTRTEPAIVDIVDLSTEGLLRRFLVFIAVDLAPVLGLVPNSAQPGASWNWSHGLAWLAVALLVAETASRFRNGEAWRIARHPLFWTSLVAGGTMIALNVASQRVTGIGGPRFAVPLFQPLAMALGGMGALMASGRDGRWRWAPTAVLAGAWSLAAVGGWLSIPPVPMHLPSGHKLGVHEVAEHAIRKGIRRIDLVDHSTINYLDAFEIQLAARLRVRIGLGTAMDRLAGHVDEPAPGRQDAVTATLMRIQAVGFLKERTGLTPEILFGPISWREAARIGPFVLVDRDSSTAVDALRQARLGNWLVWHTRSAPTILEVQLLGRYPEIEGDNIVADALRSTWRQQ